MQIKLYTLTQEDEEVINPSVWYKEGETGKIEMDPINVQIIDPHRPIRVKQYPIPTEGQKGLKPVVDRLLEEGTLEPCMSPHNTPILPIKKSDGSYRMVQDLRAVKQRTITKFPVVTNPYIILSHISPKHTWYSVIDLKDAFWACPLDKGSRDYFAFELEDPKTGRRQQLRWTVLPQGFTESPNLFGQTLEKILQDFTLPREVKLLQYVDDLLVAGKTEEGTREATIKLLNFLGEKGLKVSRSKLQFVEQEVKYLGHWLSKGKKKLDPDRVSGILSLRPPKTKKEIRQILGLLGYCRPWLESYSEKVKLLYEKLTNNQLKWFTEDDQKFEEIKRALIQARVLSLLDMEKPFYLFVNTSSQTAYGVLTQDWAGIKKPVGYCSKLLDPVSRGWPACLQALVATALLIEEVRKITFSAPLKVYTPHNVRSVLQQKAEKWLTDSRILKYEAILIDSPNLELRVTSAQSPAQFLFGEPSEKLQHNCLEVIETQTKVRPDLRDTELEKGEALFVDGSS